MKERRIGKFEIAEKLLSDAIDTGHGQNLFANMVPLDIHRDWMRGVSTFIAWHPDFMAISEGRVTPEYVAIFHDGQTAPTWQHVEGT